MRIATRLLDRDQSTLGKLFRQYAEADERAARSVTGPSTGTDLLIAREAATPEQTSRSEGVPVRPEGAAVEFRERIEECGSVKRFLAELDRLAPTDEQYAAQASAFAAGIERSAEDKT